MKFRNHFRIRGPCATVLAVIHSEIPVFFTMKGSATYE